MGIQLVIEKVNQANSSVWFRIQWKLLILKLYKWYNRNKYNTDTF